MTYSLDTAAPWNHHERLLVHDRRVMAGSLDFRRVEERGI